MITASSHRCDQVENSPCRSNANESSTTIAASTITARIAIAYDPRKMNLECHHRQIQLVLFEEPLPAGKSIIPQFALVI